MRRVCLAILAFLLLTTACADERPEVDDSAAREVDATTDDAASDVVERAVVRLAVPEEWSLDPADAGAASVTNRVLADLLYEGVTALADDGSARAALAERWFISDDRLTWTFVFPDDLTDNDGAPITARDVKGSLERIAARGPADQAATALTVIEGWDDRMTGEAGGVAGISAPDETTLVIRLSRPYELLLEVLASPAFGITGETDEGSLRTTGSFRATDDPAVFDSVDADSAVSAIELVTNADGAAAALAAGQADWAVLASGDGAGGLDADVVRRPLELEVAIVARSPVEADRIGLLGALEPLLLAPTVDGLTARAVPTRPEGGDAPDAAFVDIPAGQLEALGEEIVEQLEEAGVTVFAGATEADEFADRVAAGDAMLFPMVIAGGTGPASALLRLADPGGSDDVFGPPSEARAELAQAVANELDLEQRALFLDALERELIDSGFLLPVGRFEVRIALGHRLDGLAHRDDGTLDVSGVVIADPAS